jgi:hypothetical protein
LQLGVLIKTIRILSIPPVGRPARWLHIGHFVRTWSQDAEKRFGRHCSCTDLDVIGLLQHASPFRPKSLEAQDEFLKSQRIGVGLSQSVVMEHLAVGI